jgi:hypothetical protein
VKIVANEGSNFSGNASFQGSSHNKLSATELHNAYFKFKVKYDFIHTTNTQWCPAIILFLMNNRPANFISQV